jgi:hypothetical protein
MSIVMKMKSAAKCLVPVLAFATLSAPAAAGDVKRSPGTMCQPQSGYYHQFNYYGTGAVHNMSTTAEGDIICPIVWEDATGSGQVIANVLNLSATRYLSCQAESFSANDYGFGSISYNGTYQTDWKDLSFGTMTAPADGYTVIRCNIPRCSGTGTCVSNGQYPSGVASYRVL